MSEMMRRELTELYGVPAEKIRVAALPVDTRRFQPGLRAERAALRRKFGFNDGRLRLLFPSGGHRRKGLDLLIAAARLLPHRRFEVVLAGAKPSARHAGAVNYLGYVREMEQLYAACDATVMPSRYEPLGLVYLESVLCGTPAVLPRTAGAAEILSEPQAVMIDELTPAAVAAAVERAAARGAPEPELSFVARHGLDVSAHTAKVRAWLGELGG
jgi:glycosyltransferase involved in cell wall biosynthesis